MRKSMIAGIVLILAMIFSMVPAYAGSINGPEAGLIRDVYKRQERGMVW